MALVFENLGQDKDNLRKGEGMRLADLRLRDFRSYEQLELEGLGGLTVFTGRNGAGKTNILEAISLLTSTQSFRRAQISQLIRQGAAASSVEALLTDGNRRIESQLSLEPGHRRHRLNGKDKRIQEVRGLLPAVWFTPDDLELAKKGSSVKRQALDDLGVQLTANYYVVRRDYEKVIRYKNRLLKDAAPAPLVESMDELLLTCGSQLFCYRVALIQRLAPLMASTYRVIAREGEGDASAERLEVVYRASWQSQDEGAGESGESGVGSRDGRSCKAGADGKGEDAALHAAGEGASNYAIGKAPSREQVKEAMTSALAARAGEERARHRSLVGPHRDTISLLLDGRDASLFASQGQQRSIVLAWKLAEVEAVRQSLGMSPVLLLDDVMSELDSSRRDMLVRFVTDDMQAFMTATDLSAFDERLLSRARVIGLPLEEGVR